MSTRKTNTNIGTLHLPCGAHTAPAHFNIISKLAMQKWCLRCICLGGACFLFADLCIALKAYFTNTNTDIPLWHMLLWSQFVGCLLYGCWLAVSAVWNEKEKQFINDALLFGLWTGTFNASALLFMEKRRQTSFSLKALSVLYIKNGLHFVFTYIHFFQSHKYWTMQKIIKHSLARWGNYLSIQSPRVSGSHRESSLINNALKISFMHH